jgi:hypothetical protein
MKNHYRLLAIALGGAIFFILRMQNELPRQGIEGGRKERKVSSGQHQSQLCRNLGAGGQTASSIWRKHIHDILDTSIHPKDEGHIHQNWTKQLLDLVTPELMERALRTSPSYSDMDHIVRIIDERLHNSSAPPLHVGVFGGSVTEGSGCDVIPKEMRKNVNAQFGNKVGPIRGRKCAWPYRLQLLADSFLGHGVVVIHNLAVGGTNSIQAIPVLNYWLYPPDSPLRYRGPDVVVNAYSTNDNYPSWGSNNSSKDFTFFHQTLNSTQNFLQTALRSRPCHDPPVVLFFDEYIGNQHELLLGEDIRHDAVQLISNQAKFGYISSAFAARPLVHADTSETLFSASWYRRKRLRDVHFGMPGHVYVSWVFAYSILKAMLDFCEDQQFHDEDLRSSAVFKGASTLVNSDFPPDLTSGVSWTSVTSQWRADETARVRKEEGFCQSAASNEMPCPFAFVATPAGTTRNANQLQTYLKPFQTSNTGWRGENDIKNGWQNKLGLTAKKTGASITLTLKNIENSIRYLTLNSLKSYGEKWANSEAEFNITIWKNYTLEHETSFRVKGYHNQNTSIAYSYNLDLGAHSAKPGRTVTLDITLVGGSVFKIQSLMLCSR